jgi:hypothetical protein
LIHIDYFTSFLCKSKAVMPRRNAQNSGKGHGPYLACKKCKNMFGSVPDFLEKGGPA